MDNIDKWAWLSTGKKITTCAGVGYLGWFGLKEYMTYKIIGIAALDVIGIMRLPLVILMIVYIRNHLKLNMDIVDREI